MNKIKEMLNMPVILRLIEDCPIDEYVIAVSNWSINKPYYGYNDESGDIEDMIELEDEIGYPIYVNQYDDLIIDVHGIFEC